MKKFFTIMLMAVAIAMSSNAQVMFGLKGGLNLTKMTVSNSNVEDMFKNKAGFFIGPTVKFTLPIVGLGIDASALYDQRKSTVGSDSGNEISVKQQSIQIPINVRYGIGLGSSASIYFFAGPQFGFNVGDKTITSTVADWTFKSSNFSANVGAGLMLLNHLQVSVNYNFAFGKTGDFSVDALGQVFKEDAKLNAWQIGVAYFF